RACTRRDRSLRRPWNMDRGGRLGRKYRTAERIAKIDHQGARDPHGEERVGVPRQADDQVTAEQHAGDRHEGEQRNFVAARQVWPYIVTNVTLKIDTMAPTQSTIEGQAAPVMLPRMTARPAF